LGAYAEVKITLVGLAVPGNGEVDSSNGKDEVKQWKLSRKLRSGYTFGLTKELLRRSLRNFMSFDGL
jgi:hypothetical protein